MNKCWAYPYTQRPKTKLPKKKKQKKEEVKNSMSQVPTADIPTNRIRSEILERAFFPILLGTWKRSENKM